MRRRFLVSIVLGLTSPLALASPPLAAAAREPSGRKWRIGFLSPYPEHINSERYTVFKVAMRDLGYVEGANCHFELRIGDQGDGHLRALAVDLTRTKVDVIVAAASPAIRAAKDATSTIPIVMGSTGDPVGSGFVASLARPGGNVTGLSSSNVDTSPKLVELVRAVVPQSSKVAILGDRNSSTYPALAASLEASLKAANLAPRHFTVHSKTDLEASFQEMKKSKVDAVIVVIGPLTFEETAAVVSLAMRYRLPLIGSYEYGRDGALLGYSSDYLENYRRAAVYVDKILKGANPGDLPVEQSSRFKLLVNLKAAKALGLTIPQALIARADQVVE